MRKGHFVCVIKAIKSDTVTENKTYYAIMFNIALYGIGQFIMLQRKRAEEIDRTNIDNKEQIR